jgi:hypothetical protein
MLKEAHYLSGDQNIPVDRRKEEIHIIGKKRCPMRDVTTQRLDLETFHD